MMCYHIQPSLQQRCHSPLAPVTGDVPHWLLSPCVCCTPREPLNTMVVVAGPAASLPVPVSGASCTPHMSPHCPAHLTSPPRLGFPTVPARVAMLALAPPQLQHSSARSPVCVYGSNQLPTKVPWAHYANRNQAMEP